MSGVGLVRSQESQDSAVMPRIIETKDVIN